MTGEIVLIHVVICVLRYCDVAFYSALRTIELMIIRIALEKSQACLLVVSFLGSGLRVPSNRQ